VTSSRTLPAQGPCCSMASLLSALPRASCALFVAASVLLIAGTLAIEDLALDDECTAADSECALNALQRKGVKGMALGDPSEPTPMGDHIVAQNVYGKPWKAECEACMQNNLEPPAPVLGASLIWHYAWNCWDYCGGAGACSWCGPGNACCKYRSSSDPAECHGVGFWPVLSFHTCVQPVHPATPAPTAPPLPTALPLPTDPPLPGGSSSAGGVGNNSAGGVGGGGAASGADSYFPQVHALALPSEAPVLTFYMYRAMGDADYPPENVNAANLAGVMWYLHNEVVVETPRKFGITRIVRMKVQTKAPQPLLNAGMNFGVRYAFDSGECTGPWNCSDQFAKYGYFVGCNYVSNFPTDKWRRANYYTDAMWYSLPGPCSSRKYNRHDGACAATQPGGACAGSPSGRGNCTYSYTPAGEIRLDELEGIGDYEAFIQAGQREYVAKWDRGLGLNFWNGKFSSFFNQQRINAAERLFALKHGEPEALDTPKCDFNYHSFYH